MWYSGVMERIIRKDCVPYYTDIVPLIDDSFHGEQLASMKLIRFYSYMVQKKGSKCFIGQAPSQRTSFDIKHHELIFSDIYRHNRTLDIDTSNTIAHKRQIDEKETKYSLDQNHEDEPLQTILPFISLRPIAQSSGEPVESLPKIIPLPLFQKPNGLSGLAQHPNQSAL